MGRRTILLQDFQQTLVFLLFYNQVADFLTVIIRDARNILECLDHKVIPFLQRNNLLHPVEVQAFVAQMLTEHPSIFLRNTFPIPFALQQQRLFQMQLRRAHKPINPKHHQNLVNSRQSLFVLAVVHQSVDQMSRHGRHIQVFLHNPLNALLVAHRPQIVYLLLQQVIESIILM